MGKLTLRLPLARLIEDQRRTNGVEILPVRLTHVLALESLPLLHKDPFDRLLVAQTSAEDLHLLSVDPLVRQYPVQLLD